MALGEMLLAVDLSASERREVVLVRPASGDDAALLSVLRSRFAPAQVVVRAREGDVELADQTSLVRDRPAQGGRPTAYVCVAGACRLPVTDPEELRKALA